MLEGVVIRNEVPAHIEQIAAVTVAAFQVRPHGNRTEQFIVAGLRRSGALSPSLVAEEEGRIVGHIAFSPVSIADGSGGWYGLGPVSVAPSHQGRGIGQTLVRDGLMILRERGAGGCVVLGSPGYYGRFGFAVTSDLTFMGAPSEFFMALHFAASRPCGEVTYHEAFDARA